MLLRALIFILRHFSQSMSLIWNYRISILRFGVINIWLIQLLHLILYCLYINNRLIHRCTWWPALLTLCPWHILLNSSLITDLLQLPQLDRWLHCLILLLRIARPLNWRRLEYIDIAYLIWIQTSNLYGFRRTLQWWIITTRCFFYALLFFLIKFNE